MTTPLTLPTEQMAAFAGYESGAQWLAAARRLGIKPVDAHARPQRWSVAEVKRVLDRTPLIAQDTRPNDESINDRLLGLG